MTVEFDKQEFKTKETVKRELDEERTEKLTQMAKVVEEVEKLTVPLKEKLEKIEKIKQQRLSELKEKQKKELAKLTGDEDPKLLASILEQAHSITTEADRLKTQLISKSKEKVEPAVREQEIEKRTKEGLAQKEGIQSLKDKVKTNPNYLSSKKGQEELNSIINHLR